MAELPTLAEAVQRKLTLKWESLIETCGSTDSRRAHLEVHQERSIEQVGTAETIRLATQRFRDVAEEYLKVWMSTSELRTEVFADWLAQLRSSVLADVANVAQKSERHAGCFERACRPKVDAALAAEMDQWIAKARELELRQLEGGWVEESPAWCVDLDARLARGREALERSRRIQEEIAGSRVRTNDMWKASQELISKVRQHTFAQPSSLKREPQTHDDQPNPPAEPIGRTGSGQEVGFASDRGGAPERSRPVQQTSATLGPVHDVSRSVRRRQQRHAEIERVRLWARKMREEGATHREVCQRLQNSPRPPRAEWRHLPWDKAYMDKRYRASVCKWLSRNCQP